ncbi:MAG: hypothetical protein EOP67_12755 [Sphingomonas sp.]|nr:MAG: hypothetical protein EOP67_12755 [Sphingomonas sp.]
MTRAKTPTQVGDSAPSADPIEERVRVRQARESVQDAIGKIIGEPLGDRPDGDQPDGDQPDHNRPGEPEDDVDDGVHKPASPPPKRKHRIDKDGTD